MTTQTYNVTSVCDIYKHVGGDWVYQKTYSAPRTMQNITDKTSIDTGGFQPGVYRVNPYYVREVRHNLGNSTVEVFFTFSAASRYKAVISGATDSGCIKFWAESGVAWPPEMSSLMQRALQKAHGKILENEVGIGENLFELKQTLDMLRHPFQGFRDFLLNRDHRNLGLYQKLKHYITSLGMGRGVWRGKKGILYGKDAAKTAADTWLEFRYGLMPLVYTVQDIIDLVNKKAFVFDPDRINTAKSTLKETINSPPINGINRDSFYPNVLGVTTVLSATDSLQAHASVQYQYDGTMTVAQLLGLTPEYLPELLWELTRLSFVVDWWFSVGDWLASMRVKPGVKILGNTVSRKIERNVSVKTDYSYAGPSYYAVSGGSTEGSSFSTRMFERLVDYNLQYIPHLKLTYKSHLHTVDALALTLQPLLKKLRR